MSWDNRPFKIHDIYDFVPEKIKPWILVIFVLIYQLSGGVYLAAVSDMTGSLGLRQEDILMAGYASLVGLSLTFVVMFRLKFAYTIKSSLLMTAGALILCNLIVIFTDSVPILVGVSFIAGFFRMWGTFACNTTIQLWITPKRDMAVWFVYIYLLVQGSIQLSGIATLYTAFLSTWEYMHWVIIALLLMVVLVTQGIFKRFVFMKKLPLYGIDWTGWILWATTIMAFIFVLNYGEHYDWFDSDYIRAGLALGVISLILNLWRASFIRHPLIELRTWTIKNVWLTFLLYILVDILLSPVHLFEHIYTEAILGYDALHLASLNWIVLAGTFVGAIFAYRVFAIRKWRYKTMTIIGFMLIAGYLMMMYFTIDFDLPKKMLVIPLLLRAAGYVIIAITFITALSGISFQIFPQTITIQAFVSASLGALLGSTLLHHLFNITAKKNFMLLSTNLDSVNQRVHQIGQGELFGVLQKQAIMVSMKELYGWLVILSLLSLMVFLFKASSLRPKALHPKFKSIRKSIKHQLKMDRLQN
ncbi:hypothetical protein [Marinilabilia salmonicolor]|jgi:hypothetical protein|uniref:MFS transporter n=1 Tax=Marinilabilia salmonicolor TaxID=989 RepID=A0A2T0XPW2_9BACT|nr:hypothetical protein [Marinilabilia salmonicolor]PRZ00971.1 hypothetical protein BY457_104169 [Marinilabilia salmonicolor]RCW31090.1 hypothetical protein DFO77_11956 [Marinilabilia salmonicolor]